MSTIAVVVVAAFVVVALAFVLFSPERLWSMLARLISAQDGFDLAFMTPFRQCQRRLFRLDHRHRLVSAALTAFALGTAIS
jgi:predicted PurR-regulated permease PerM